MGLLGRNEESLHRLMQASMLFVWNKLDIIY